jgi:mannose/fructose/N-acetylgalactosamine-specific phosphotransferase system component IIC
VWGEVLLVSLISGLLLLDRRAAFQFMISRPIVIGPVIGITLQQPAAGAILGGLVELLWISRPPLGGHIPPNEGLGVAAAASAVMIVTPVESEVSRGMLVLGFLMVHPAARLAVFVEGWVRRVNGLLLNQARKALDAGRPERLPGYNLAGLAVSFTAWFLCVLALTPAAVWLLRFLLPLLPLKVWDALEMMYILLPLIGVAAALSHIRVRRNILAFGLCYAGALILLSV